MNAWIVKYVHVELQYSSKCAWIHSTTARSSTLVIMFNVQQLEAFNYKTLTNYFLDSHAPRPPYRISQNLHYVSQTCDVMWQMSFTGDWESSMELHFDSNLSLLSFFFILFFSQRCAVVHITWVLMQGLWTSPSPPASFFIVKQGGKLPTASRLLFCREGVHFLCCGSVISDQFSFCSSEGC